MKKLKPLSPESLQLKEEILKEFNSDSAFRAVLDSSLRARDLYHEAMIRVDAEGLTITGDRGGTKCHPLLDVVKSSRAAFFAGFKLLKLDVPEETSTPGHPTTADAWRKRNGE